jgi:hypothetical protein
MKRLTISLLAGVVTALALTAVFAGNVLAAGPGTQGPPNASETTLEVSPNPVPAGTPAIFTATVTYKQTGTRIKGATVELQQLQLSDGTPVPTGTPYAVWVPIDTATTDDWGQATFSFDTTGLAGYTIGFRAKTKVNPNMWSESQSPGLDLVITEACTGVHIAATLAAGEGSPPPGYDGCWTFRITVKNCDLSTRVFKVQGGSNGWTTFTSATPTKGRAEIRYNRRSEVITWWVELSPGEEQSIFVTVCGTIKPSTPIGTVLYLSGAWSAAYTDDYGNPAKSDYTGRVSITVSAPSP